MNYDINIDFELGFSSKKNDEEDKKNKEIYDQKTKNNLRNFINVKFYDMEHDCHVNFCKPRNILNFIPKNRSHCLNVLKLNPDIYFCELGKFHDCSNDFCTGTKIENDCSCSKTGLSKNHGYSAFETEKRGYCGQSIHPRKIIHRDNWEFSISRNRLVSMKRDDVLNRNKLIYMESLVDINKSSEQRKKKKRAKPSIKKNHMKKNSKTLMNENNSEKLQFSNFKYDNVKDLRKIFQNFEKISKLRMLVFRQQIPIKINNFSLKKNEKQKHPDLFNYPIYFSSERLHFFLKSKVSLEQIAIQFQHLSYWKMFKKKMINKGIGSKIYMKYENIIKITEKILLHLLPGLIRLRKFLYFQNYFGYLHTKAKQYVLYCAQNNIIVDFHKIYETLNFDLQKNNERPLEELINGGNHTFENVSYIYDKWPNWKQWKGLVEFVLKIWDLVNLSGSDKKGKRKRKDPSEIALGALCLAQSEGVMKFGDLNTYEVYIPKIRLLSNPGYLKFKNELSQIFKRAMKSHNHGEKIIISSISYLIENVESWKILNFIKNNDQLIL